MALSLFFLSCNYGSLFAHRYLVDTALMTAAIELCGEILVHNFTGHVLVDETAGHHKHVGIVMLTDQVCYLWYPAQTGTDALMLVERHVDAFAAATDFLCSIIDTKARKVLTTYIK